MPSFKKEQWQYIPVVPEFGLTIDEAGGRVYKALKPENGLSVFRETTVGTVEFNEEEHGLNILAEDLGMRLVYEEDGKLSDLGVNAVNLFLTNTEETQELMGGDNMDQLLSEIMGQNQELYFNFDFLTGSVAIVTADKTSGKINIVEMRDINDFCQQSFFMTTIGDYDLYLGFWEEDDEFLFGACATQKEDSRGEEKSVPMIRVLNDCNYKTYLDSGSPDRYDKLAKRIFFARD